MPDLVIDEPLDQSLVRHRSRDWREKQKAGSCAAACRSPSSSPDGLARGGCPRGQARRLPARTLASVQWTTARRVEPASSRISKVADDAWPNTMGTQVAIQGGEAGFRGAGEDRPGGGFAIARGSALAGQPHDHDFDCVGHRANAVVPAS